LIEYPCITNVSLWLFGDLFYFLGTGADFTGLDCGLSMPASLRAICFNRRVWVRCPLGKRFVFVSLVLSAMLVISLMLLEMVR
jgi:hypothetical protein